MTNGPSLTREDIEMLAKESLDEVLAIQTNQTHQLEPTRRPISKAEKKIQDWYEMALAHNDSHPRPEAYHKEAILKHCAVVLRSAFDTNEIELACNKLTDQSETALALKKLSQAAVAGLDELATILINPELKINEGGRFGTCATLSNPQSYYSFIFWYTNGLPSVIRDADKRPPGGQDVIMCVRFYESGKLLEFSFNLLARKYGLPCGGFSFKENGKLDDYWIAPKEKNP